MLPQENVLFSEFGTRFHEFSLIKHGTHVHYCTNEIFMILFRPFPRNLCACHVCICLELGTRFIKHRGKTSAHARD